MSSFLIKYRAILNIGSTVVLTDKVMLGDLLNVRPHIITFPAEGVVFYFGIKSNANPK